MGLPMWATGLEAVEEMYLDEVSEPVSAALISGGAGLIAAALGAIAVWG